VSGHSFLTDRMTSQYTGNTPKVPWVRSDKLITINNLYEQFSLRSWTTGCHIFSSFMCTFVIVGKLKDVKYLLYLILQDSLGVLRNKYNKDNKIL